MNTSARVTVARTADRLAPRLWLAFGVLALGAGIAGLRPASAQEEPATVEIAAADKLAEIVGPIALYPDDHVAIVLPASTSPLQIVQAARFLEDRKTDSSLQADPDWDDSIVALLNYPEVVKLLNDDLDWTYDLGTAVLNQRADVLNAIQSFRDRAYAAGNLRSDERQIVARDDGAIAIKPADPKVIYVPYYEPERVVVYQTAPVYHYYPYSYPVYYYPYPAHYAFGTGFWGVRSWFSIGWHSHHVHVYDWHYHNHPYYGWNYYDPFYSHNVYVNVNVNNHDHVWQPHYRYGGRPVVRGYEGRVYTANTPPAARTGGGMASSAYRSRSVEGSAQPQQPATAQTRLPRRGVLTDANRASASPGATAVEPQTGSNAYRGVPQNGSNAPATRTYRSGGGMSQALERQRAQVGEVYRGAPAARARQESTGMPQESSRGIETRASPPPAAAPRSREPSGGGMSQAMRGGSDGGGSYRGNSGGQSSGGGDSGGRSHPAARGGEGRSAAR
jgi:hypothetical protein